MFVAADRFQTTFLGSRALVGSLLQPSNLLRSQGADGLSVEQVLQQHGFNPTPDAVSAIALKPDQVADFQIPVAMLVFHSSLQADKHFHCQVSSFQTFCLLLHSKRV